MRINRLPEHFTFFVFLSKWLFISCLIGSMVGSACAIFLISLNWVTSFRESHQWMIFFLPLGGLVIGLTYHYFGSSVVKGNNQLIEEFHSPKKIIPFRMAPLVLFSTLLTHLVGGSAGREGTAVQMGGAIADRFTKIFRLKPRDRRILLIIGISGGFAGVFGTPLAGTVFALEVLVLGRIRYEAIVPSLLSAIIANLVCHAWKVSHTAYKIPYTPEFTFQSLLLSILAGITFGLTAFLFSFITRKMGHIFKHYVKYPPFQPLIGGTILAFVIYYMSPYRFIGLGIPEIMTSFETPKPWYDFLLKIVFTSFTLSSGFKGGEVTPLFFIGSHLGNSLSSFISLPLPLLAGMGFVAVFSGATNTPIACTIMGIELFGSEPTLYLGTACIVAYLFSGHSGIYTSQLIGSPKHLFFNSYKRKSIQNIGIKKIT